MGTKTLIYFGLFIGSTLGTYAPTLWHSSIFGFQSVIGGFIGGALGIWGGFKLGKAIEG